MEMRPRNISSCWLFELKNWNAYSMSIRLYVIVDGQNRTRDNKHQIKYISRFFKSVAKVITKHRVDVGAIESNIMQLNDDPKLIYECGKKLMKLIETLNRNRRTALTFKEQDQIEADFCSLVSWVSMCNTYDLWGGEFGGGSICAAILKMSGTDPVGILGAKDDDPIRNITY